MSHSNENRRVCLIPTLTYLFIFFLAFAEDCLCLNLFCFVCLQKKAVGSDLYEQTFYSLDLIEKDYFGLQYTDANNVQVYEREKKANSLALSAACVYVTGRAQTLKLRNPCSQHWLDPTKAIKKQVKSEYRFLFPIGRFLCKFLAFLFQSDHPTHSD